MIQTKKVMLSVVAVPCVSRSFCQVEWVTCTSGTAMDSVSASLTSETDERGPLQYDDDCRWGRRAVDG
jgi:hypothetical protein